MVAGIKLTKEEFIVRSQEIFGNYYDYSLVEYKNYQTPVSLICPKHGIFQKKPEYHLNDKAGCRACKKEEICSRQRKPINAVLSDFKKIHGNYYNYSKMNYVNNETKIIIICPKHNEFKQTPNSHKNGNGCKKCSDEKLSISKRLDNQEFIERASKKHNFKYDYSLTKYKEYRSSIMIICPTHGEFKQIADYHLAGNGCQKCKTSSGELEIIKSMNKLEILYERQKKFKDCKNIMSLPFDFYLPHHNCCIEYDGEQHFKEIPFMGGKESFIKRLKHDKIKTEYCVYSNIRLLRISYKDFSRIDEIISHEFKKNFIIS